MERGRAWDLLTEFTESDSLRKHALAVEAAMRAYAARYGVDPETWGAAIDVPLSVMVVPAR